MPLDKLLSKECGAERRARIDTVDAGISAEVRKQVEGRGQRVIPPREGIAGETTLALNTILIDPESGRAVGRRRSRNVVKTAALLLVCGGLSAATLRYWIEPCPGPASGCRANDMDLAEWAMEAWQAASAGRLKLEATDNMKRAHIRLYWSKGRDGLYGEARPITVDGVRGAEVYVQPAVVPLSVTDVLLRDAIVYLTCLHETGHALGLAHTDDFADIMYSFQYGGDIPEYFGRYRRQLATRADIRTHAGMSGADRKRLAEIYR